MLSVRYCALGRSWKSSTGQQRARRWRHDWTQRLKLRASLHCRSSRCVPLVQHTMLVTIADEARMCWHTLSATWATQSGVAKGHDEWLVTGLLGKFNVAFGCYILRRMRRLRLPKGSVVLLLSRRNWWKGKRPDLQLKRPQSRWVPSQSYCPATPCPVLLAQICRCSQPATDKMGRENAAASGQVSDARFKYQKIDLHCSIIQY